MMFCTRVRVTASHQEDGAEVIDAAEILDLSLVGAGHQYGASEDGTLHLPGAGEAMDALPSHI